MQKVRHPYPTPKTAPMPKMHFQESKSRAAFAQSGAGDIGGNREQSADRENDRSGEISAAEALDSSSQIAQERAPGTVSYSSSESECYFSCHIVEVGV